MWALRTGVVLAGIGLLFPLVDFLGTSSGIAALVIVGEGFRLFGMVFALPLLALGALFLLLGLGLLIWRRIRPEAPP